MIGMNLKRIRQKKKMTQQQLAEKLGVSRQAICLWEADKREVRVTVLSKISNIFKVNVGELLKVAKNDIKEARFEIEDLEAEEVFVIGDFTNWEKSLPLRRSAAGLWRKNLPLKPGRYEYKFIVDGEWRTDPKNNCKVYNSMGTLNSVKEI